ncbi:hypothetical protein [Mycobacterium sp. 852002-10029_SCH5224772]|uniref:hypothetical protein n=1 Tax=Mycobacterium sp. 852002-10029_SCH5224772 TaxID=1834083 RepID=UPI0007FFBF02|nr:hypothetical protein [Mycobacterium sp. 852002-10029_SCH5224772]OBE99674.1 hypothetical protein A5775_07280 [Mycobacterium sp. 852002-10029_SCH5224772]
MQKIKHDVFGNVVVSDMQPQGVGFRARIVLFQLVQNLLIRVENFPGRSPTHGGKERFEAVITQSAAAK